ncbi:MAG: hypothetical protein Q4C96_06230 [Planctomycetia bacterium]|nr:hypothetical protein [Planctomycetia bacterium]
MIKKILFCIMLVLASMCYSLEIQAGTVVAVGSIKSLDALWEKAEDITGVSENEKLITGLGSLKFLFTENGLVGMVVDTSRPVGVVMFHAEKEKFPFIGFWAIPVNDWGKLETCIKKLGVKLEKQEDGIWNLDSQHILNFPRIIYGKKLDNWFLISDNLTAFEQNVDFVKYITENTERVDVGFSVFLSDLPEEYKKMAVRTVDEFLLRVHRENCSGEAEIVESMSGSLKKIAPDVIRVLNDLERITYGHIWNKEKDEYTLGVTVIGKGGTKVAQELEACGKMRRTNFAGFSCPDATLVVTHNWQMSPFLKEIVNLHLNLCMEKHKEKISEKKKEIPEEVKGLFVEKHALVEKFFQEGKMEGAVMVKITDSQDAVFAGGFAVPDGYACEAHFLKSVEFLKKHKAEFIKEVSPKYETSKRDDLRIYSWKCPVKSLRRLSADESFLHTDVKKCEFISKFQEGDELPVAVIYAPKAVYFAVGKDAKIVLEKCLADSKDQKDVPAFQVKLSLMDVLRNVVSSKLFDDYADDGEKLEEFLKKAVKRIGDAGRGEVFLEQVPEKNGMQIRFRATTSAIKMLKGI